MLNKPLPGNPNQHPVEARVRERPHDFVHGLSRKTELDEPFREIHQVAFPEELNQWRHAVLDLSNAVVLKNHSGDFLPPVGQPLRIEVAQRRGHGRFEVVERVVSPDADIVKASSDLDLALLRRAARLKQEAEGCHPHDMISIALVVSADGRLPGFEYAVYVLRIGLFLHDQIPV